MFHRLLVPLDGSALAETALPPAVALAKRFEAELSLVRAEHALESAERGSSSVSFSSRSEAQHYLSILVERLKAEGIAASTALALDGPAGAILDQAELDQVDLIVMATHGRTGFDALLHPSMTWQVFSQTSAPILVCKGLLPEAPARPLSLLPRFMTDGTAPIIVPLDGSLQAEAALPLAKPLAQTFGNPLQLVRVVPYPLVMDASIGPVVFTDKMIQWSLAEAENYLKVEQEVLRDQGLSVAIERSLGFPRDCLEASVQDHHAGLVVMTSHGRGWWGRLVLGSVARQLLEHLHLSTLLVRPCPAETSSNQRQIPAELLERWAQ